MASDYREHLDPAALRLLAETTGFNSAGGEAGEACAFHSRPHDIRVALASPKAARLLDLRHSHDPVQHGLLQIAVAVHQTAEDICQAGWIATDESIIDLNLLSFSGQSSHQQFIVGLLASYLRSPSPVEIDSELPSAPACDRNRLEALIALCEQASDTERAGALRLLGDEALFTAGLFPAVANAIAVDNDMMDRLLLVLPKAVVALLDELRPQLQTLLDVYLLFGPIWYRMAAQNVLFNSTRESLNAIASEFSSARRFLVQVAQGPLAPIKHTLYPEISQPV